MQTLQLKIAESCSGASLPSPKTPTAPVTESSPDLETTLESPECSPGLFVASTPFGNRGNGKSPLFSWRFEWKCSAVNGGFSFATILIDFEKHLSFWGLL